MVRVHITDDHAMVVKLPVPVINDSGISRVSGYMPVALTPREKQVLQIVAAGMGTPQIAERLGVELSTVLSFRKKLNLKPNASDPVELVANARKKGFID